MRRPTHRPSAIPLSLSLAAAMIGCNLVSGASEFAVAPTEPANENAGASENPDVPPPSSAIRAPDAGSDATNTSTEKPDGSTTAPDDAGPVTKLVFVTGSRWSGALGGLEGADEHCKDAASQAGLASAEWRAWLSTKTVNAISRIKHDGPYALRDGRVVVQSKAQLASGAINVPIDVTEAGTAAANGTEEARVWTGTNADGNSVPPDMCGDWTSSASLDWGIMGSLSSAKASWTRASGVVETSGGWGCQTKGRIYCFEL